ncbi:MAG: glycosyltransferase, partial [bacterium]
MTHCLRPYALACVIVTYNRAEQLRRCLIHTLEQDVDLVVIIDNGSSDGTSQVLAEFQAHDSRLKVE